MVCLTHELIFGPILANSQVYRLRFFSKISHFASLVITPARKVRFQKEKLHLVAQSELYQIVCLTQELIFSPILAFSQDHRLRLFSKISHFASLVITPARKVRFQKKRCIQKLKMSLFRWCAQITGHFDIFLR